MRYDVVIIGAGPAGLSFAGSLAGTGLSVAVLEKQPEAAVAQPAFDGREIALTHASRDTLTRLGAWARIPAQDISPLKQAVVLNGKDPFALRFSTQGRKEDALGFLVPNHQIRQALYDSVASHDHVTLQYGQAVTGLRTGKDDAEVQLADGSRIQAKLVVAADTRFSETRRRMGISAAMQDFGKVMMVCRMAHDLPHDHVATEWFDYGQTIAILPCNGDLSSVVITLPAPEIERLVALEEPAFNAEMTERLQGRLGQMRLVSTRHAYPLVGVYADRFVATRFALIGDAAVGMHPVTAHGFNFGLLGQNSLARAIRGALSRGQDIANPTALARFEAQHRRDTRLLYMATNATARLYSDERLPARVLRDTVLRLGQGLPFFRDIVRGHLMQADGPRFRLPA